MRIVNDPEIIRASSAVRKWATPIPDGFPRLNSSQKINGHNTSPLPRHGYNSSGRLIPETNCHFF
jgi:hypothetical protein